MKLKQYICNHKWKYLKTRFFTSPKMDDNRKLGFEMEVFECSKCKKIKHTVIDEIEVAIKCDNLKEAEFIEKYLLDKGYKWSIDDQLSFKKNDKTNDYFPIMIFKRTGKNIDWVRCFLNYSSYNYKITDVKQFITQLREEKLKRINNDRF